MQTIFQINCIVFVILCAFSFCSPGPKAQCEFCDRCVFVVHRVSQPLLQSTSP